MCAQNFVHLEMFLTGDLIPEMSKKRMKYVENLFGYVNFVPLLRVQLNQQGPYEGLLVSNVPIIDYFSGSG